MNVHGAQDTKAGWRAAFCSSYVSRKKGLFDVVGWEGGVGMGTWNRQNATMVLVLVVLVLNVCVVVVISERFATGRRASMGLIGIPMMCRLLPSSIFITATVRWEGKGGTCTGWTGRRSRGSRSSAPMRMVARVHRWRIIWCSDITSALGTGWWLFFGIGKMVMVTMALVVVVLMMVVAMMTLVMMLT